MFASGDKEAFHKCRFVCKGIQSSADVACNYCVSHRPPQNPDNTRLSPAGTEFKGNDAASLSVRQARSCSAWEPPLGGAAFASPLRRS